MRGNDTDPSSLPVNPGLPALPRPLSTVFKDPSLSTAWTPRASLYHEGPGGLSEEASLQPGGQDTKALFSWGSNPWSPLHSTAPER